MSYELNQTNKQENNQNVSSKQTWVAPVLETCNVEHTMSAVGSNADAGSPTS